MSTLLRAFICLAFIQMVKENKVLTKPFELSFTLYISLIFISHQMIHPLVLSAPATSDHITQHLKDGATSFQKAAYEAGGNLNNGLRSGASSFYSSFTNSLRNGANSLYSGVGQATKTLSNVITAPYSFARNRITSAIRNMPSSALPSTITNIPSTIRNIPSAIGRIPSVVGNGIWNTSSRTVNGFGRNLIISGRAMDRLGKRLEETGKSIEDYQWVRVPRKYPKLKRD